MKLYTIGYAGKTAQEFFTILRDAGQQKTVVLPSPKI